MYRPLIFILIFITLIQCTSNNSATNERVEKPNIVIFYVDDLGYGDLSSYGAEAVQTPNVDLLANGGIMFTDAHSSSATCTPSRYSLLTGKYAFRKNAEILPGDAPLLIDTSSYTLPRMLQDAGYKTGVIGKWHLGLGYGDIDWNGPVSPGPLEIGFDYSFLLPATGDRVPTVYLENHNVVDLDVYDTLMVSYKENLGQVRATPQNARYISDQGHSETLVNGVGRIGSMVGGESAHWVDEEFPVVFTNKARDFINNVQGEPFFLYFSFHDIHVPRLPHARFAGKTEMGPRGDAIVQMDWMTGEVMNILREKGLEENTMVIFTSDNGAVLNDGYEDFAVERLGDHKPSGPFKGGKYSSFEGGTRVPMIVYWPGKLKHQVSNALISQVDYFASIAELLDISLDENIAIDSEPMIDIMLGQSEQGREYLLEESFTLSLRKGNWKYIEPLPQSKQFPKWLIDKGVEAGSYYEPQLFNLEQDICEQINLASDFSEMVENLEKELARIKSLSPGEKAPEKIQSISFN